MEWPVKAGASIGSVDDFLKRALLYCILSDIYEDQFDIPSIPVAELWGGSESRLRRAARVFLMSNRNKHFIRHKILQMIAEELDA